MAEITINVRDDIPDALRDALIDQLTSRPPTIAGNLADLQRLGAQHLANEGPSEVFRLNPNIEDIDRAKAGAERTLREEEEARTPPGPAEAGPDEPREEKDPRELARTGEVDVGADSGTRRTRARASTDT